jgi:hypothetical protein
VGTGHLTLDWYRQLRPPLWDLETDSPAEHLDLDDQTVLTLTADQDALLASEVSRSEADQLPGLKSGRLMNGDLSLAEILEPLEVGDQPPPVRHRVDPQQGGRPGQARSERQEQIAGEEGALKDPELA